MEWPEWWRWELDITSHLEKRMQDRGFSELDLREMLHAAAQWAPDVAPGRWVIRTTHGGRGWEVVVEPEAESRLLVVITAYPKD